jgi:hypothetical protein
MPRTPMTDEERAAKKQARADAVKAKRDARKAELRAEIERLASKLPPHIVQGGGTDGSCVERLDRRGYRENDSLACVRRPLVGCARQPSLSR